MSPRNVRSFSVRPSSTRRDDRPGDLFCRVRSPAQGKNLAILIETAERSSQGRLDRGDGVHALREDPHG